DRDVSAPGGQVPGGGHITTETDQDVGLDAVQQLTGDTERARQLARDREQFRGEFARQGDRRDHAQLVATHGYQPGLQSPFGSQAQNFRAGVDAPQCIRQRERGLDMPGRAASGKGYPHRRRFLLGRSPAAGTGPFLCWAAVLPPRAPEVRGARTVRLEVTPSLRFWGEKAIFSRPSQLRAL